MTISQQETPSAVTQIELNWRASKNELAGGLKQLIETDYGKDERLFNQGNWVGHLLYDLGHNGRGMGDFPYTVEIIFGSPVELKKEGYEELKTAVPLADLVRGVTESVQRYLDTNPRGNVKWVKEAIETLTALQDVAGNRRVDLVLRESVGKTGAYDLLELS